LALRKQRCVTGGQEARVAGSPLVTTTSGFSAASSAASAGTAVAVCLTLSAGQAALAGTNDILIGLDEKITYGPDGNSTRSRHAVSGCGPKEPEGQYGDRGQCFQQAACIGGSLLQDNPPTLNQCKAAGGKSWSGIRQAYCTNIP
jgi:hypothetical protein